MATTKFVITDDKVVNEPSSTEQTGAAKKALSTYGAYVELAKKLDINATSADVNKVPIVTQVGTEYKLVLKPATSGANADWSITDESQIACILHKPFQKIGTGLTVKQIEESGVQVNYLTADTQLHFQIFETLPTASSAYAQTIALIKVSATSTNYTEYACVNKGTTETPTWDWEVIGGVELQITQDADSIKINGTTLNTASASQIGLISKTDWDTFNKKQEQISAGTTGKVEVLKYTETAGTVDKLEVESTITTDETNTNLVTNGAIYGAVKGKVGYAPATVSTASVSFTVGKDDKGFFIYEE